MEKQEKQNGHNKKKSSKAARTILFIVLALACVYAVGIYPQLDKYVYAARASADFLCVEKVTIAFRELHNQKKDLFDEISSQDYDLEDFLDSLGSENKEAIYAILEIKDLSQLYEQLKCKGHKGKNSTSGMRVAFKNEKSGRKELTVYIPDSCGGKKCSNWPCRDCENESNISVMVIFDSQNSKTI